MAAILVEIKLYFMKVIVPCMRWLTASEEQRIRDGTDFIALIWSEIADKIIEKSVHIYELNPEQAMALRQAFRRYTITLV